MSYGAKTPMTTPQRDITRRSRLKHTPRLTSTSTQANRSVDAKKSHDRYVVLARAAETAGDKIEAENLYQHAEHYFRLMQQAADGRPEPLPQASL